MLEQRLAKMEQILLPEGADKLKNDSNESISFAEPTPVENRVEVDKENSTQAEHVQPHSVTPNLPSHSNSNESTSTFTPKNKHTPHRLSTDDLHETNSPTSFSSISSNFPSPPAHMMNGQHTTMKIDYSQEHLPPIYIIEHIIDLFFKYLFSSIPIFDEATLRNDINERKCPDFLILCLLAACAR